MLKELGYSEDSFKEKSILDASEMRKICAGIEGCTNANKTRNCSLLGCKEECASSCNTCSNGCSNGPGAIE
ncbi:MAG: hypothetical protein GTO45_33300 [Candidatus Aminicenantes bacterium]|nr:hypothetical protein [Candidatus Aminicenantes bacterium]NIN23017.1 hypothetical protein [Candidatus Aminicenantes bacterium]NIN46754.1 hypothetical protein [Candidatus Aminicenantes bacterium]NIN89661.1 hypothetical protein [Candidatus Aminicenantes bacterium]NIO86216.1 hypothetical protein [Candidatus Aminicenantes bacterium]